VDAAIGQHVLPVLPLPGSIAAMGTRTEPDSLEVPANPDRGAQTHPGPGPGQPGSMGVPAGPDRGGQTHPGSGPGQPGADPSPSSGPVGQV
jgi:hypothetical protein